MKTVVPILVFAVLALLFGTFAEAGIGNFAYPIGPALVNSQDAGTYPNLTISLPMLVDGGVVPVADLAPCSSGQILVTSSGGSPGISGAPGSGAGGGGGGAGGNAGTTAGAGAQGGNGGSGEILLMYVL